MKRSWLVLLLGSLFLSGCLSFSSSDPSPPNRTTVVVPEQSPATVCNPSPC
ncbi:hypothetical protein R69919_01980 [Paraburkholderia gardini]|uniref:Lipoprotein n=1 Tax=Paraburkholderia gardini TaxID=2823469 RepID=A0ABN7QPB8_9BURK|nr:hypothetical protein R69919_01980 [Paraburkholderia gardini]CAG4915426.1 hypothetical protein R54767_04197 [Paraburkholderia gardini]